MNTLHASTLTNPTSKQPSKWMSAFSSLFLRFWMIICTMIFFFNVYEALYSRLSGLPIPTLADMGFNKLPTFSRATQIHSITTTVKNKFLSIHVWPVPIWLALMFLQLSPFIRKKYLNLHRILGRVSLLISISLNATAFLMVLTEEQMYGSTKLTWDLSQPEKMFSFSSGSAALCIYWIYCTYRLYKAAKFSTIDEHQYWAYQFVAAGFVPGSLRVFVMLYNIYFWIRNGSETKLSVEQLNTAMGYSAWVALIVNTNFINFLVAMGWIDVTKKQKQKQKKT